MAQVESVAAQGEGVALTVHPRGNFVATLGKEGTMTYLQHKTGSHAYVEVDQYDIDQHHGGDATVNHIVFSHKGDRLVSCGDDNSVCLYEVSEDEKIGLAVEFTTILTRFEAKALCAAFSPDDKYVAAGGADHVVRLVAVERTQDVRQLEGHKGPVRSICFDPEGKFLITSGCDGMMGIWDVETCSNIKFLPRFPKTQVSTSPLLMACSWSPKGRLLAVPCVKSIMFLERGSWNNSFNLDGEHTTEVSAVAFSPCGKFIASAGLDMRVCVWALQSKEVISSYQLAKDVNIVSLAWSQDGSEVLLLNSIGHLLSWYDPVPAEALARLSAQQDTRTESTTGSSVSKRKATTSLDDDIDDDNSSMVSEGDDEKATTKKQKKFVDDSAMSDGESMLDEPAGESLSDVDSDTAAMDLDHYSSEGNFVVQDLNPPATLGMGAAPIMQKAFQPGATRLDSLTMRRFLAWNHIGHIICKDEDDGHNKVEIDFTDKLRYRKQTVVDRFKYTMAALGEHAAVFACPPLKHRNSGSAPATIYYRPFDSWAPSEWTVNLPNGEKPKCVTLGSSYVAVFSSNQYLRLFSTGGVQKHILSIPGPIVSAAGSGSLLFYVYHSGMPMPGCQNLSCALVDTSSMETLFQGPAPISHKSALKWVGFSSRGCIPALFDTNGVLRGLFSNQNYSWVPLLETKELEVVRESNGRCFPVAFTGSNFSAVVCVGSETQPPTHPMPIPTSFPVRLPVLDTGLDMQMEEEYLRKGLLDNHLNAPTGSVTTSLTLAQQAAVDKMTLVMYRNAVLAQKQARAFDLASGLLLTKSMKFAVVIATKERMEKLARKLDDLLQEQLNKAKAKAAAQVRRSSAKQTSSKPQSSPINSMKTAPGGSEAPKPASAPTVERTPLKSAFSVLGKPTPTTADDEGEENKSSVDSETASPAKSKPAPKPRKKNPFARKVVT